MILLLHSLVRYVVLILLIALIVKSFMGMQSKGPFTPGDNKLSLLTFIATHTQLLLGLILYFFVSPAVTFGSNTMKDGYRQWTVEHLFIMLIAIVLITLGRSTMKKLPTDTAKHKRLFIFNLIALVLILMGIAMTKRGFFGLPL
jgi:hypothetical protein